MVPAVVSALVLLLVAAAPARAGLDLTPQVGVVMKEDLPFKSLVFHDGATEISYIPPHHWTYEGGINNLTLTPPDCPLAEATVRSDPHLRTTIDNAGIAAVKANPALLGVPKGSTSVAVKNVALNTMRVCGHDTLDAEVSYNFFGQERFRNILIVNRNGAEVAFTIDAMAADYPALKRQFRQSLYSLDRF